MVSRIVLVLIPVLIGCTSRPAVLVEAPKPGMIGQPRFSTDDNSTSERVTFRTRATEAEVRSAFEEYCSARLHLKRDTRPQAARITWWQGADYYLGILVTKDTELVVTHFYNR
jgi:hypothetical protein